MAMCAIFVTAAKAEYVWSKCYILKSLIDDRNLAFLTWQARRKLIRIHLLLTV